MVFALSYGFPGDCDEQFDPVEDTTENRGVEMGDCIWVGLRDLAPSVDARNKPQRVVFEHAAQWGIIRRMEKAARRRG